MIPLVDLKSNYRTIQEEAQAAVCRVLESGHYVMGPDVAALEEEFGRYVGSPHAVAVNSGTSALHLAFLAAGIGPGDEVITVPFTFVATVAAICYTGARAVLVDVDPVFRTMDPARLEAAITPRTKAIVPVHLHGHPADLDPILEIARQHGLRVVEDAAQAHGAEHRGRRIGSLGDFGCFSFYPGKNLGACGEGGLVTTADPAMAERLRLLRDWGQDRKYHHQYLGYNYRLDTLQAAILRVKLRRLEEWTEARRAHAAAYDALLGQAGVTHPRQASWARHVYHVYAIESPWRDDLASWLQGRGIHTGMHYPIPVHLQPAFAHLGYGPGDFPVSEHLASQVLSLPMFPELTRPQVEEVTGAIQEFLASR